MKNQIRILFGAALVAVFGAMLGLNTGCTTTQVIDPVTGATNTISRVDPQRVYVLAKGAASIGTTEALRQKPEWRDNFLVAKAELDKTINDGTIDGIRLREIMAQLPIRELHSDTARVAIQGATLLFDFATASAINIEKNEYVLAASRGVSEGIGQALNP